MANIFDWCFKAPNDNEVERTSLKHQDRSATYKCSTNIGTDVMIFGNVVKALVKMATDNVSIASVKNLDNAMYFEFKMDNGNILNAIYQEDEKKTITYTGDVNFEVSSETWPLAAILLSIMATEKGSAELKETIRIARNTLAKTGTLGDKEAFVICDLFVSRIQSKSKESLAISTADITKTRSNINEVNGEIAEVEEDLTPAICQCVGNFQTIVGKTNETSNQTRTSKIGTGYYNFGDELSDKDKELVVHLKGSVPRKELEVLLRSIKATKDDPDCCDNIMLPGPSGCGKSYMAMQLSEELGVPFYSKPLDDSFTGNAIKGGKELKDSATTYQKSWVMEAIEKPCVIEIAEVNAATPTALTVLYDILDKYKRKMVLDDGTVIKRHPHCVFVFTMNVYGCMNQVAKSLPARMSHIVRLEKLTRDQIKQILINQVGDSITIDNDIMEHVLDAREKIETVLENKKAASVHIPKDCESSMRAYAYWAAEIQIGRNDNDYDPIYAAKTTILPVISSGAGFNETIEKSIIDEIIVPTFAM